MTSVERYLRTLIRDGALGPGAKLPTERALVEQLHAPRSAIRRALENLEQEGLVTRHVGRGTFVTDATGDSTTVPENTSPAEIMQVRLLVEPPTAALAVRVASQSDLDVITNCLEHGGATNDHAEFERWDANLHRAIAQAAHNGLLVNIYDAIDAARGLPIWGSIKKRTSTPQRLARYHIEHTAIVDALRERDPQQAHDAMREHLRNVADTLLGRE